MTSLKYAMRNSIRYGMKVAQFGLNRYPDTNKLTISNSISVIEPSYIVKFIPMHFLNMSHLVPKLS